MLFRLLDIILKIGIVKHDRFVYLCYFLHYICFFRLFLSFFSLSIVFIIICSLLIYTQHIRYDVCFHLMNNFASLAKFLVSFFNIFCLCALFVLLVPILIFVPVIRKMIISFLFPSFHLLCSICCVGVLLFSVYCRWTMADFEPLILVCVFLQFNTISSALIQ